MAHSSRRRRTRWRGLKPDEDSEFLPAVRDLAQLHGWLDWHHLRSKGTRPGWPDLVLLRPPRLIFAELKVPPNKLSPSQEVCTGMLRDSGQEVYVWTPDQWSEIERILVRKYRPKESKTG